LALLKIQPKLTCVPVCGSFLSIIFYTYMSIYTLYLNLTQKYFRDKISSFIFTHHFFRLGVDVNKKLRVCDVCGSFLSIMDSDKRLADHFMGKQHIGFQLMRDQLDAIKNRRDERRIKSDAERAERSKDAESAAADKEKEREKDEKER
jgi:hypothetical protein